MDVVPEDPADQPLLHPWCCKLLIRGRFPMPGHGVTDLLASRFPEAMARQLQ